ncbi:FAD:protein FMN transferase [Alteromonas sp. ASW11-36]|uniref:FAD:protein FMN transferase n=1 Tax=Alteromonas arenosi TaxID=3055817 RepID=A0ABT7T1Z7_9ALTE|nr:FAD:protein FMN transferase [Alteromonas sp. ASW11-36]MDM7862249.1 FAD:protein FMN transferase [Alteromonas sp. ASW11-36]
MRVIKIVLPILHKRLQHLYVLSLLFFGGVCSSALHAEEEGDWYSGSAGIMGTNIYAEVWAQTPQRGQLALDTVFAEMHRINELMSPYIESSELSLINRQAGSEAVVISAEMFDLLRRAQWFSENTAGAFDITFASVGYLYDYRQKQRPNDRQIAQLRKAIDYRLIALDEEASSIRFLHPDVKIDLGGIAKGYAVDNAVSQLYALGFRHALVTAGGDTKLLGDRRGRDWIVGIRDPRNPDRQAVVLPLSHTAMSTSGDYERYFEEDGQRYHHILSPKTGESAKGVQSVSIISNSATNNDALSTAVFVLGVEHGLTLINQWPDIDAVIMDADRKMHYSNGLLQQQ